MVTGKHRGGWLNRAAANFVVGQMALDRSRL